MTILRRSTDVGQSNRTATRGWVALATPQSSSSTQEALSTSQTRGTNPQVRCEDQTMTIVRSLILFAAAALAEIGGAWLVWQGIREHRGWLWIGAGVIALGVYGFVATLQTDANFGRILAAYGGVFVAGSLVWGTLVDGFRPDRYDVGGALVCLVGVAVIMYAPRSA